MKATQIPGGGGGVMDDPTTMDEQSRGLSGCEGLNIGQLPHPRLMVIS